MLNRKREKMKSIRYWKLVGAIGLTFTFTGCLATVGTLILGTIQSHPQEGGVDIEYLEYLKEKLTHPKNQLLTENEKIRAAKNICNLKHLDNNKNKSIFIEESKAFCNVTKNDKIYFHHLCEKCGEERFITSGYLLIKNGEPFRFVEIDTKADKASRKNVPIVDRLH